MNVTNDGGEGTAGEFTVEDAIFLMVDTQIRQDLAAQAKAKWEDKPYNPSALAIIRHEF